jgi:hypothetical protein
MASRPIELTRAAYGLVLLLAPRHALAELHDVELDRSSLAVARILGARQLVQAGMSGLDPSPEVLAMGVWVDVAHGATALGLAVADRSRATAGLSNLCASLVWAGWGYVDLTRGEVTRPAHQKRRDVLARGFLRVLPGGRRLLAAAQRHRSAKTGTGSGQVSQGIRSVS